MQMLFSTPYSFADELVIITWVCPNQIILVPYRYNLLGIFHFNRPAALNTAFSTINKELQKLEYAEKKYKEACASLNRNTLLSSTHQDKHPVQSLSARKPLVTPTRSLSFLRTLPTLPVLMFANPTLLHAFPTNGLHMFAPVLKANYANWGHASCQLQTRDRWPASNLPEIHDYPVWIKFQRHKANTSKRKQTENTQNAYMNAHSLAVALIDFPQRPQAVQHASTLSPTWNVLSVPVCLSWISGPKVKHSFIWPPLSRHDLLSKHRQSSSKRNDMQEPYNLYMSYRCTHLTNPCPKLRGTCTISSSLSQLQVFRSQSTKFEDTHTHTPPT